MKSLSMRAIFEYLQFTLSLRKFQQANGRRRDLALGNLIFGGESRIL
jgi:hypothetical protein